MGPTCLGRRPEVSRERAIWGPARMRGRGGRVCAAMARPRGSLDEVRLVRADEDPLATCFGCVGSERVTGLAGTAAVWVVWGGNSISAPVVY